MEQILEMAKDLGRAIQQDERFVKVQAAQLQADNDTALQELIGEFNLKRMAINGESAKPEADQDPEKMKQLNEELREVYGRVMANASMVAYNEAKTEMDKLLNGVGAIINMAAQGMDPDEYEEHQCGGNCSSCGGCH